ncbi:MAG TPA: hypothetical protein VGB75_04715 [Jatrophihabitans sp.]|jgi:hypothetical protein|uniref:DUF6916 family protein n=1 Tax=Jatrophihabitans sp. TaxID=1932789 RepID=UPI002EFC8105
MSQPPSEEFEDYHARVGQSFTMRFGEQDVIESVLLECERRGPQSFSLLFRAGPNAPREQGTYLLSAEDFGPRPVFLVPVRETPDGVEFHAVFNQLTEE